MTLLINLIFAKTQKQQPNDSNDLRQQILQKLAKIGVNQQSHGWRVTHWSKVGDIRATDKNIMEWARQNDYVVFTHDLDFGTLLAITHAEGPSVIQVRTQDIMTQSFGTRLVQILRKYEPELKKESLITIDEMKDRIKILPF